MRARAVPRYEGRFFSFFAILAACENDLLSFVGWSYLKEAHDVGHDKGVYDIAIRQKK